MSGKLICFFCHSQKNAKHFQMKVFIPSLKEVFNEKGKKEVIEIGHRVIGYVCNNLKCQIKARKIHKKNQERDNAQREKRKLDGVRGI